ncbi:MAG: ATP-binding protein [Anaeromyxobacteraceae bacterium]
MGEFRQVKDALSLPSLAVPLRRAFLRAALWLVPGVALQVAVALVTDLANGPWSPVLLVGLALVALLGGAAWRYRERAELAAPFLIVLVASITLVGTARYGPLAASGAYLVVASVLAPALLPRRLGLALAAAAVLAFVALGAAMTAGLVPVPSPALSDLRSGLVWTRVVVALTIAVVFVGFVFQVAERHLLEALAGAAEDRARALAAERERAQSEAALAMAQRVASIGFLAGGFAHDVKNALAVVQAGAQALRTHPAEAQEVVGELELAASSCAEAAQHLLALARDPEESGRCRPRDVLAGLARMLKPVLPQGVALEVDAPVDAEVPVAEGTLTQALLNVVLNARDAMPDGGRLALRARLDPRDGVVIEVEDSGLGMDPDTLARVFDPFFTTKPAGAGTGLGLPMVKRTIERAGGTVRLASVRARGTTVRIALPVAASRGKHARRKERGLPLA